MITTFPGRLVLAAAVLALLGGCSSVRSTFGLERKPPDEFAVVSRAPLTLPPDFSLPPPSPGALRPQESVPSQQAAAALFGVGQQSPRMALPAASPYDPPISGSAQPAPRPFSPSLPPGPGSSASGGRTPGQSATAASRAGPNALQTPATGPAQAMPARRGFAQAQAQPARPSYPASSGEGALLNRAGADSIDGNIRQTVNQETAGLLITNRTTIERLLGLTPRANDAVVNPREESARLRQNAATGAPVTQGETPTIARRRKGILDGIF